MKNKPKHKGDNSYFWDTSSTPSSGWVAR